MRTAMRTTVTLKPGRSARPARVEPVFTLLFDHLLPTSEIAVSHGAVHVDHALLEALEQVEVKRAVGHRVAGLHTHPYPEERQHAGQRIHRPVDGLADPVTHRQRREERQDQVRAGPCAPDAKRLAEVLAALLDLPVLRSVEEPADAEGAVYQEPPDFTPRPPPLALEQVIDRARDEPDVVEAAGDQQLEGLRHDLVVDLRCRFQEVPVEPPVELEHPLVERLPGIVVLLDLLTVRGRGRHLARALRLRDRGRPARVALGGHALLTAREERAPGRRGRDLLRGELTRRADTVR